MNKIRLAIASICRPIGFEGEGVQPDLTKNPVIIQMQQTMSGLANLVKQQGALLTGINTNIQNMSATVTNLSKGIKPNGDGDDGDDDSLDDDEIEKMPKKAFFEMMMKEVGKLIDGVKTEVKKDITGIARYINNKETKDEVVAFAGDHKDLREWDAEIGELAKSHPTLRIADLYTLARAANPKKASEMDTKYPAETQQTGDEGGLSLFGGLRPTISGAGGSDDKSGKKTPLTVDEALDKAWNSMVSKVPALAGVGDEVD